MIEMDDIQVCECEDESCDICNPNITVEEECNFEEDECACGVCSL